MQTSNTIQLAQGDGQARNRSLMHPSSTGKRKKKMTVPLIIRNPLPFLFVLIFTLSAGNSFAEGDPVEEKLVIDGVVVETGSKIKMQKDETFRMQVSGVKPNSNISLIAKFAGVKVLSESIYVDENGEVDRIFSLPNIKASAKCIATYRDRNGNEKRAVFKLRIK